MVGLLKRVRISPPIEQQEAIITFLRTATPIEIKTALSDKKLRYTINEVFMSWRLRTQIRHMREQRGWTQDELARRCGLTQPAISRLENVYAPMVVTIGTLQRIARAFDVALIAKFCGWASLLAEIINMGCRLIPLPFEDDPAFKEKADEA